MHIWIIWHVIFLDHRILLQKGWTLWQDVVAVAVQTSLTWMTWSSNWEVSDLFTQHFKRRSVFHFAWRPSRAQSRSDLKKAEPAEHSTIDFGKGVDVRIKIRILYQERTTCDLNFMLTHQILFRLLGIQTHRSSGIDGAVCGQFHDKASSSHDWHFSWQASWPGFVPFVPMYKAFSKFFLLDQYLLNEILRKKRWKLLWRLWIQMRWSGDGHQHICWTRSWWNMKLGWKWCGCWSFAIFWWLPVHFPHFWGMVQE